MQWDKSAGFEAEKKKKMKKIKEPRLNQLGY